MDQSELFVLYNFIAYFVTFLIIYRIKGKSLGVYLLLLYTICSLSSVLYVTNPLYKGFATFYLFVLMFNDFIMAII